MFVHRATFTSMAGDGLSIRIGADTYVFRLVQSAIHVRRGEETVASRPLPLKQADDLAISVDGGVAHLTQRHHDKRLHISIDVPRDIPIKVMKRR